MPGPLLLGVPLIPVAVNAVVGVAATIAATRLIGAATPTTDSAAIQTPTGFETSSGPSIRFWEDGINATEAAMIGAVGLSALAVAYNVTRGR